MHVTLPMYCHCIKKIIFLVRPKTIVFGRTYVLAQMFYLFIAMRDLRDAWADRREILHDGQY